MKIKSIAQLRAQLANASEDVKTARQLVINEDDLFVLRDVYSRALENIIDVVIDLVRREEARAPKLRERDDENENPWPKGQRR